MGKPFPLARKAIDKYALSAPFAYALMAEDPGNASKKVFPSKLTLARKEAVIYESSGRKPMISIVG